MPRFTTEATPVSLAFIVGQLGLGGAEQQLYYLLSGLDRQRFAPTVITLGAAAGEHWEAPIAALDVPLVRASREFGRPGRLLRIAAVLRGARAALVHAWSFHANVYAAMGGRMAGVPIRFGSLRESYAGLPENALGWWSGLRGLDGLVTNSSTNAESLRATNSCSVPVHVVPNGVHVPEPASDSERERLKVELGFSATDRVIGTVARLDANKNLSMLLRAFHRLPPRLSVRLAIIGSGPTRDQLLNEVATLGLTGRVSLTGALPNAARYLPAFEVCCLTSRTEGTPNLLMEASAAAVPVVATDCGGSGEVVTHGATGFLVRSEDDADFAVQLERLLSDPAEATRMGQAGRQKVLSEFSIPAMVDRMTAVYSRQLAIKTGSAPAALARSSR